MYTLYVCVRKYTPSEFDLCARLLKALVRACEDSRKMPALRMRAVAAGVAVQVTHFKIFSACK